jgi:hypothetical protein
MTKMIVAFRNFANAPKTQNYNVILRGTGSYFKTNLHLWVFK